MGMTMPGVYALSKCHSAWSLTPKLCGFGLTKGNKGLARRFYMVFNNKLQLMFNCSLLLFQ